MVKLANIESYGKELAKRTEDPIHKRIISAYKGEDPKKQMEKELGTILTEVVSHED